MRWTEAGIEAEYLVELLNQVVGESEQLFIAGQRHGGFLLDSYRDCAFVAFVSLSMPASIVL
jgi:hypothetical protein